MWIETNTHKMGKSQTVHIYDLDDTLIRTSARIIVRDRSTDGIKRYIPTSIYNTSSEHTHLLTTETEYFDFSEFNDPDLIVREKLTSNIGFFEISLKMKTPTFIITSREDTRLIKRWVRSLNLLDTSSLEIFCTFSKDFPYDGDDAERKMRVLEYLYKERGYKCFRVWEDSPDNMRKMKSLEEMYPDVTVDDFMGTLENKDDE